MTDGIQIVFECAFKLVDICHITSEIQGPAWYIFPPTCSFIVYHHHMMAFLDQTTDEMGANESSTSCNQDVHALISVAFIFSMSHLGAWNFPLFDFTHSQRRLVPVSFLT